MSCWEFNAGKAKEQLALCTLLMDKLQERVKERCKQPKQYTSYDMPQPSTNAALERQITVLRMELLELQKIIRA